jgi:hypothetical protein
MMALDRIRMRFLLSFEREPTRAKTVEVAEAY